MAAWAVAACDTVPRGAEDASFIARNILASQRGPLPRGWFDIALGWDEPQCLDFVERIATAQASSWWHVSQFIIAEVEGKPAASLCALPRVRHARCRAGGDRGRG